MKLIRVDDKVKFAPWRMAHSKGPPEFLLNFKFQFDPQIYHILIMCHHTLRHRVSSQGGWFWTK
jgi:hypothetical protein